MEKHPHPYKNTRLTPFFGILREEGFKNDQQIAAAVGTMPQTISYYRRSGDIRLGAAKRMLAAAAGIRVVFSFEASGSPVAPVEPEANEPPFICNYHYTRPINHDEGSKLLITKRAKTGKNIDFIARTVLASGLTLMAWCRKYNLPHNKLYTAINSDDIQLSLAIQSAHAMGKELHWHLYNDE